MAAAFPRVLWLVVVVHVIRVLVVVEFSEVGLCLTVCGSLRDQRNGN